MRTPPWTRGRLGKLGREEARGPRLAGSAVPRRTAGGRRVCSQEMLFGPLSVRWGEGVGACKQPPLLPSCQAWLLPPQPPSSLGQVGFRVSVSLEFLKINPIGQDETMCRCLFQKDF